MCLYLMCFPHEKFFIGNIDMILCVSPMTKVSEIIPHVRQGPTYST